MDPTLLSPAVLFRVESEEMNVSGLETSRGCLFLLESHKPSNKESNEGYKRALPRVTFNVVYVSRKPGSAQTFHTFPHISISQGAVLALLRALLTCWKVDCDEPGSIDV